MATAATATARRCMDNPPLLVPTRPLARRPRRATYPARRRDATGGRHRCRGRGRYPGRRSGSQRVSRRAKHRAQGVAAGRAAPTAPSGRGRSAPARATAARCADAVRRSVTVWVLSAALLGAAAGCGGGDDNQGASSGSSGTPPQQSGKELFTNTCAGCHTLKDAGANGQVGPNLDEIAPDKDLVLATLRAGPGAMPENLLVGAEADRVATYVSSVAGKSPWPPVDPRPPVSRGRQPRAPWAERDAQSGAAGSSSVAASPISRSTSTQSFHSPSSRPCRCWMPTSRNPPPVRGAARAVVREHPRGELVEPRTRTRGGEVLESRTADPLTARLAGDIDAVLREPAYTQRSEYGAAGEADDPALLVRRDDTEARRIPRPRRLAQPRLERRQAVLDALVVDLGDRGRVVLGRGPDRQRSWRVVMAP